MRKYLYSIVAVVAIWVPPTVYGNEDVLIRNTLQSFFAVLRSGNAIAIEARLGGDLHKQRKTLLRSNREYSQFLRQYYRGTEFRIENIEADTNQATVDVSLIFPDGEQEQLLVRLAKEQGTWKIVESIDKALRGFRAR